MNPWSSSTPMVRPPVRSGWAGADTAREGMHGHGEILHHRRAFGRPVSARLAPISDRWRMPRSSGGRGGAALFYWFLKWIAIGPLLRVIFRPHVEGAEHVPTRVPRSSRATTSPTPTGCSCRSRWHAGSRSSRRRSTSPRPGIKGWFQKKFFAGAGQVPIDRVGRRRAEGALASARRILEQGDLFGIYPEGTRSHDGKLYRGKTGVARLALETGVPVIPVAVLGTDVVAPPGKKFGTFTRPGVRFGKPLDFSRYEGMENDRYILRSITDEIMYEIMRLSGQEYVDHVRRPRQGGVQAARARGQGGRRRTPRRPRGRAWPSRSRRPDAGPSRRLGLWSRPALAVEDRLSGRSRCCGSWSWSTPSRSTSTGPTTSTTPSPASRRAWPWSAGRRRDLGVRRAGAPHRRLLVADLAVALGLMLVSPLVKGDGLAAPPSPASG